MTGWIVRLVKRLHGNVSLFYKILIANTVFIALSMLLGAWFTANQPLLPGDALSYEIVVIVGIMFLSLLVNYGLLRLAFHPLFLLHGTMEDVQAGNFAARAPDIDSDPDVAQLADTLNLMLDRLERHRRSVSSQILTALEEERTRIARELHDETGQSMTVLIIRLEQLISQLERREDGGEPDMEAVREGLRDIRDLTSQGLDEVRRLTFDLRPSVLDDLGLVPALRWYAKEKLSNLGFDVEQSLEALDRRLPANLETALFRIMQEALTNVVRHAEAERVRVKLRRQEDWIHAVVEDDGRGFDVEQIPEEDPQGRGLGLFGMKERAELVGGRVKIASQPGEGTRVAVWVPAPDHDTAGGRFAKGADPAEAAGEEGAVHV